jgi:hypothetical protein
MMSHTRIITSLRLASLLLALAFTPLAPAAEPRGEVSVHDGGSQVQPAT